MKSTSPTSPLARSPAPSPPPKIPQSYAGNWQPRCARPLQRGPDGGGQGGSAIVAGDHGRVVRVVAGSDGERQRIVGATGAGGTIRTLGCCPIAGCVGVLGGPDNAWCGECGFGTGSWHVKVLASKHCRHEVWEISFDNAQQLNAHVKRTHTLQVVGRCGEEGLNDYAFSTEQCNLALLQCTNVPPSRE